MEQELLMKEVERVLGHRLAEASDFEQLSHLLLSHTRERLSPTTLKRLWGYLSNEHVQTRRHTLDVLARFVGYRDYATFCEKGGEEDGEVQSGIMVSERLRADELKLGQRLMITWRPDRRIVVRHQGSGLFAILEAEQTKLAVGDTFRCHLIIRHEPLYLDDVRHAGLPPKTYVAGSNDGIEFCVL